VRDADAQDLERLGSARTRPQPFFSASCAFYAGGSSSALAASSWGLPCLFLRASFALLLAARLAENPIILLFRISPAPTLPELINIKAEQ